MGVYWLHDLPAEAAARGVEIETYSGWELRSRSTGGFDEIRGVCMHHTAGSGNYPENDMAYMWLNAQYRPVGNIYLATDGTITLGAAGAANTQGRGGPLPSSKGTVPLNQGNKYYIAIEAANNGIGQIWPQAQILAYERLVAALCDIYDLDAQTDVVLHATWAPTRKIDPAGPTPTRPGWGGLSGAETWDLAEVRDSVDVPSTPPIDMSSFQITNPVRILDTRTENAHNPGMVGALEPGDVYYVQPHGFTPPDAEGVILTVTGVGSIGHLTFWDGVGVKPLASNVNMNMVGNNMVWVPLDELDGTFAVGMGGPVPLHAIIDQVGWYTT